MKRRIMKALGVLGLLVAVGFGTGCVPGASQAQLTSRQPLSREKLQAIDADLDAFFAPIERGTDSRRQRSAQDTLADAAHSLSLTPGRRL